MFNGPSFAFTATTARMDTTAFVEVSGVRYPNLNTPANIQAWILFASGATQPTGDAVPLGGDSLTDQLYSNGTTAYWDTSFHYRLGWEQVQDSSVTEGSPQLINQGDTAVITMNPTSRISSQLPLGVDSFYNSTDDRFYPANEFDAYDIRIDFRYKKSSVNGYAELHLDIGDPVGIIVYRVVSTPRGAGVEQKISLGFPVYAGSTFFNNGGQFKIYSANGNTQVYQPIYFIKKSHHGR